MFSWVVVSVATLACGFALLTGLRDLATTRRLAERGLLELGRQLDAEAAPDNSDRQRRRAMRNELSLAVQRDLGRHALGTRLGWRICAAMGGATVLSLITHSPRSAVAVASGAGATALVCAALARTTQRYRNAAMARCNRELDRFEQTRPLD